MPWGGPYAEYAEQVLVDAIRRGNADQFAALAVVEHDHDFLGLQDHRDPLHEAPQGDIGLIQGRDINGLGHASRTWGSLDSLLHALALRLQFPDSLEGFGQLGLQMLQALRQFRSLAHLR